MIQQDNIKDYAISAFRYYGHNQNNDDLTDEGQAVVNAVRFAFRHLEIENDAESVEIVKKIYCSLPMGKIKRCTISNRVAALSNSMNMDARTIWRKLKRARDIFNAYYSVP